MLDGYIDISRPLAVFDLFSIDSEKIETRGALTAFPTSCFYAMKSRALYWIKQLLRMHHNRQAIVNRGI